MAYLFRRQGIPASHVYRFVRKNSYIDRLQVSDKIRKICQGERVMLRMISMTSSEAETHMQRTNWSLIN